MVYAPIVIPTLNRIEHLQRCIASLQINSWAQYTPLVISVDYPPSEKYEEGYRKVCNFLKLGLDGFQSVEIIYQEKNLGAYDNSEYLRKHIEKKYDRYIFTEDDNEFSPNFIEFIDKGLEKFEKDENIIAICANGIPDDETNDENVVLTQNFSAFGYGTWIKKENIYYHKINRAYLENKAKSMQYLIKVVRFQETLFLSLQSALFRREKLYQLPNEGLPVIDEMIKIYLIAEQKYVIAPSTVKVRNWGYDGSGENCPNNNNYKIHDIEIDRRDYFEYKCKNKLSVKEMKAKYTPEILCRIVVAFVKIGLWRIGIYKGCKVF